MSDFETTEKNSTIVERFERMVARCPANGAIQTQPVCWSYAELNAQANQIAHTLMQQTGCGKGQVAVFCETFAWQMAATLAVIKTGQVVVILDPSLPDSRLSFILADAQVHALFVDGPLVARAHSLGKQTADLSARVIQADTISTNWASANLKQPISPHDPLVLLYTSGSTGNPKGVVITHQAELHSAWSKHRTLPLGQQPRGAVISSLAYGATWGMAFRLLSCGGCLCEYDFKTHGITRFAQWIEDAQITLMVPPIALIRQWCNALTAPVHLFKLRALEFIGALVSKQDLCQIRAKLLGDYTITLLYGSTEALNLTSYRVNDLHALPDGALPAGYLIPDTEVRLIDAQGLPVAPGEVGEIVVQSRYISPGYWQRPALNQAKFATDPQDPTMRLFFTGDLGRQAADGCLHITGRKDFMVKIRGYRVELSEVEQALLALAGVQSAVVVACDPTAVAPPGATGEKELVAYLVLDSPGALTPIQLRLQLTQRLPAYMLPARFVRLDALPLTPNGKVDRQALVTPNASLRGEAWTLATFYQAPRTPLEAQLVAIWEAVLGVRPVGIADQFLDLGGSSLSAMQVHARLNSYLQTEIPARLVFTWGTIGELALQITQEQAALADQDELAQILAALEATPAEEMQNQ